MESGRKERGAREMEGGGGIKKVAEGDKKFAWPTGTM